MTMAADPDEVYAEDKMLEERDKEPETLALDRCDDLIRWYEKTKNGNRRVWRWSQIAAVTLSGVTPVLVIIQTLVEDVESWRFVLTILIALFPALVAIITGYDGLFQPKDNYIRVSYTSEALKSEKIKYLTRTTPRYNKSLDNHKALSNFVASIEKLAREEVSGWRELTDQGMDLDELIELAGQKQKSKTMQDENDEE